MGGGAVSLLLDCDPTTWPDVGALAVGFAFFVAVLWLCR